MISLMEGKKLNEKKELGLVLSNKMDEDHYSSS